MRLIALLVLAVSATAMPLSDPSTLKPSPAEGSKAPSSTAPAIMSVFEGDSNRNDNETLITATSPIPDLPAPSFGSASFIDRSTSNGTFPTSTSTGSATHTSKETLVTAPRTPSTAFATPVATSIPASGSTPLPIPDEADLDISDLPLHVNVPGGQEQWWVLNTTNYLVATPPSGLDLRVALGNSDPTMMEGGISTWDLGSFRCGLKQQPPVCIIVIANLGPMKAGDGYRLYLFPSYGPESIIGASDTFKIEPAGSPKSGTFTVSVEQNKQPSPSAVRTASSGATRAVLGLRAAVAAAAAGLVLMI